MPENVIPKADLEIDVEHLYATIGHDQLHLLTLMKLKIPHDKKARIAMLVPVAFTLVIEVGIPLGLYFGLRQPTGPLAPVWALLISSVPAAITVVLRFVIQRRFDPIGFLVVLGLVIAAIIAGATQNARILLLEKSIITGAIGAVFLVSLIPLRWTYRSQAHRLLPLAYVLSAEFIPVAVSYKDRENDGDSHAEDYDIGLADARQPVKPLDATTLSSPQAKKLVKHWFAKSSTLRAPLVVRPPYRLVGPSLMDYLYQRFSALRHVYFIITALWGLGFVIELIVRLVMIFTISDFDKVFLYSNIVFIVVIVVCGVLTLGVSLLGQAQISRDIKKRSQL
ncbi:hypothetical protein NQZ79_g7967 [Umbelopsis isabellina]|nr:hypothetical protein NQZ79_g7967 [Umbelopsis isabellina]